MRPITVLTLIILGSCVAISVCLIAVWGLLFLTSQDPALVDRVSHELSLIPKHVMIFVPMTLVAAMSFLSSQKQKKSRWYWQTAMWGSLCLIAYYYIAGI